MSGPARTDHLLTAAQMECLDLIIEEALEVGKAASKMKRFGMQAYDRGVKYDNVRDLSMEIGDLREMTYIAHRLSLVRANDADAGGLRKREKLKIYARCLR